MTNKLKCDQVALKQDLRDDIQPNAAKLETKFQSQLRDFQPASTTDNNNLNHQIAQINAATDRLNTRLSAVENQATEGKDSTCNNTDTDGLTKKVLNRINLRIQALLRKQLTPSKLQLTADKTTTPVPSRRITRRSAVPQKTNRPPKRNALLTTARDAAMKQIQDRATNHERSVMRQVVTTMQDDQGYITNARQVRL
ncbi:hypothetical protein F443_23112 [Phytophthora nicotianae P1569]|uniref:Uncharacterized protein n=1 Tax=Phytophthora nicotianae P1569 TaxID=1317065 RepID=V9DSY7_PHYNI|nr:hypothetical protein F443_23112 [Phytophthora nicotianae P1569]